MMNLLIKNTKLAAIAFLMFGAFLSCDDDDDLPEVEAAFTYTIDKLTGEVIFINVSENASKYLWNFGDGTTSTEISPVKKYETGTYTVVLEASNLAGDSKSFTDEVEVDIDIPFGLPLTFDGSDIELAITAVGGAQFAIVDNPDLSGTNTKSSKVGAIVNSGAAGEGITLNLEEAINLSQESTLVMNFWSDFSVPVTMQLGSSTATGRTKQESVEVTTSHSGNKWEFIEFDFGSTTGLYTVMTIYVDKTGTTKGIFYFDEPQPDPDFDTKAPVITLNGDAVINQNQGNAFTDPGATATDDVDGNISANIVVGGDAVDINTIGTYVITYNVADAFGNQANEVTRTVNILSSSIDVTPPVIVLNGASSVTLTVGATYTEEGATATDDKDGTLTVEIGGDMVDTGATGTYVVTYTATDAAGNSTTVERTVTVGAVPAVELITNGDFENTAGSANQWDPWFGFNNINPEIQSAGTPPNNFYFANVQAPLPNNAFEISLQQIIDIEDGKTYTITFDASTGDNTTRTIGVGIGKQGGDFQGSDEESVTLSSTETMPFSVSLTADGFGAGSGQDSEMGRIFFDLGGSVGVVIIDNVSVKESN